MTDPTADTAKLLPCPPWRSMKTAPLDGTPVLLHTTCYGIVEAWYSPGHWEYYREGGEYYGAQWVCADDAFQIEVEEIPEEEGGVYHGTATAWMPLELENTRPQPAPPAGEPDFHRWLDQKIAEWSAAGGFHDFAVAAKVIRDRLGLAERPKVEDAEVVGTITQLNCSAVSVPHWIAVLFNHAADLLERLAGERAKILGLVKENLSSIQAAEAHVKASEVRREEYLHCAEGAEAKLAEREAELAEAAVHLDHEMRHRFIPLTNRPTSRTEITEWLERHAARQQKKDQQ